MRTLARRAGVEALALPVVALGLGLVIDRVGVPADAVRESILTRWLPLAATFAAAGVIASTRLRSGRRDRTTATVALLAIEVGVYSVALVAPGEGHLRL